MKLNRLETHDRLKHFLNQEFSMGDCAQNQIDQRPFGDHPFYIFCHPRTDDDGVSKRYIWSPWIWKPRPQSNSLLLKGYPGSDVIKVMWIIPPPELWDSFKRGNLFENQLIKESIDTFQTNRELLCQPEDDDPSAEVAQEIAFEYQPQLFKRNSLPEHLKAVWDRKMRERENERHRN